MSNVNEVHVLSRGRGLNHLLVTARTEATQAELAQLREAVSTRQRLGFVTGLVAERYGLSPDEAWAVLVGLSQKTNVKVRDIARLILDGFCGQVAEGDRTMARRLNRLGPAGGRPLVSL